MCSGAPLAGAVLLNQPLAWATQLQSRAVNQEVDRPTGGARLRWQLQALGPSAEGREIADRLPAQSRRAACGRLPFRGQPASRAAGTDRQADRLRWRLPRGIPRE